MKANNKNSDLIILKVFPFVFLVLIALRSDDYKSEYTVPRAAYSISTNDIDLDGNTDIIVGHLYNWQTLWGGISILKNENNGYFTLFDSIYIFGGQTNVLSADINNDSLPDLLGIYSDGDTIYSAILEKYDTGYLQNYYPMGQNVTTYEIGKINEDNFYDIVFISNLDKYWGILYNDSNGNFSNPLYFDIYDYNPINIACADLNGDGRDDVVLSSAMKTEIFFSLESGFQSLSFNTASGDIFAVDFDNDGDPDIVSAHQPLSNFSRITFFENLGNGNFTLLLFFDFQPKCSEMAVSDFDNDSLPDLLLHTQDAQNLLILYNKGNFELSEPQLIPVANYGESIRRSACADFDGNGYNDIATIRYLYAPIINLNILFNDGQGNFIENPITNVQDIKLKESKFKSFPNPFKTETNIKYQLTESSFVNISVFNLNSELIKVLTNQKQEGGKHVTNWNGLDNGGKPCKPGPYLLTFKVNGIICKSIKIIKY